MLGSIAFAAMFVCAAAEPSTDGSGPTLSEAPPRPYRTVVRPRPRSRQQQLDRRTPGFVSVVELDGSNIRARDGLAEILARVPGVHVRSLGGLGQFSALSIRGSSPQQVGIFLDGVPVTSSLAGLMDLADLPIDGLSRVEVHRGYVPIAFGAAALGGALNLVSAGLEASPAVGAEAGLGSWWARQARVHALIRPRPRVGVGIHVGYAGARGDFIYRDNAGTPTLTGDDRDRRRAGNGYDRVLSQLRVDARLGKWNLGLTELVVFKHQGVPGPGSAQAYRGLQDQVLSRTTTSLARHRFARPGTSLQWIAGVGVQRRRFQDPAGELGVGVDDQVSLSVDTYLSPRWRTPLWRQAFLRLMADSRTEWIDVDQRAMQPPRGDARRARWAAGVGIELEQFLWQQRIHIVPALRYDGIVSAFAVAPGQGEQDDQGRRSAEGALSPRLGTRVQITPWLSARASVGRYFRMPTLVELFGDRGWFVGNEGLRAERGVTTDGGFVADLAAGKTRLYGQLSGFYTRSRDLIQWISAGTVARPENLSLAQLAGVEGFASMDSPHKILSLALRYTWLDSEDRGVDPTRRGRPLPGRPKHEIWARGSFGYPWQIRGTTVEPRLRYTLEFVAQTYLDPSGRYQLPPRSLQTLGFELGVGPHVHAAVDLRNLLDVRTTSLQLPGAQARTVSVPISDVIGYPLPGRSLWASIRVAFDLVGRRRAREVS